MRVSWKEIQDEVAHCQKCALGGVRNHPAFGEGNPAARLMLIGEGPGFEEDRQGRPFVGPAGQLLNKMLAAIDLNREDVYIANIVKCRPPKNREPLPEEAAACLPYLRAQTALIKPEVILCLGRTAAQYVFKPDVRITRDRGVWKQSKGIWVMATYHPAALLRDPTKKRDAWVDLQAVRDKLKELETIKESKEAKDENRNNE